MPHQRNAWRYLLEHRHGALFMEMRTGKSLPTIRRIRLLQPRRVLIMAPTCALGGWESELALEGETDVVYLTGPRKRRLKTLRAGHRWNLINKEGWRALPEVGNRARIGPRAHEPVPTGERITWDAVVLDESPFLKSPRSQVTRFVLKYLRSCATRRYILTGLPAPEGPEDYWTQFAFLDGRAFGHRTFWGWRAAAFRPNELGYGWSLCREEERCVRAAVQARAFVCSRQDACMPEKHIRQVRRLDMPTELRKTYRRAEREFILEYRAVRARTIYAVAKWQWLRQMCDGIVDGRLVWPGKVYELRALLRGELRREQVVVWFAYNHSVRAAWNACGGLPGGAARMTGATALEERRAIAARFARGEIRVLLLQQRIAAFGVDLSAADTAIYYSRHADLQTNAQCRDRIVHPSKANNLLHIDFAVRDSVDEDVADALAEKRYQSQKSLAKRLEYGIMRRRGIATQERSAP